MEDTATDRPYVELLRADLADYEEQLCHARAMLAEQPEYMAIVIKQLERGIAMVRAKIET